jgi:hypothetical protein
MSGRICETDAGSTRTDEMDRLEAHVQSRLNGRVRDLCLLLRGNGLVLQGHAHTYYVTQLAQQAVMEATELPILANEIVVS